MDAQSDGGQIKRPGLVVPGLFIKQLLPEVGCWDWLYAMASRGIRPTPNARVGLHERLSPWLYT